MEAKRRLLNEIEALHELVDDLDYYGVLLVDRDCAPHEIGEVVDTGHATVKVMFASGLGRVWQGERDDVEVMALSKTGGPVVVGEKVAARLRGLPETRDRGRAAVHAHASQRCTARAQKG